MLFGGYRGGYNVMPQGWMDAATQVGKNYAQGIQGLAGGIAGGVNKLMDENASQSQNQQSLPTNMSQYEQVTQATGQQMDPTIIERFANRGELSGAGLMQLNKDIAGAQQNAIALANMQRQQAAFQAQQQALAQAQQAQALSARRANIMGFLGGTSTVQPAMPQGSGQLPTVNPLLPNVGGF
jgi:hypothetical protein